ncbi:hypothetical protein J4430_00845 [Candidatus Woesearchaeota archaeon]|nr:hypothetical protein [Candidatus Woesearchaeota archaeon]
MAEPTLLLDFLISKETMLIYFSCIISASVSVVLAERWYRLHPQDKTTKNLLNMALNIIVDIFGYLFMLALFISFILYVLS